MPYIQACPKSGPRAKSSPRQNFVRPAAWFIFMKRIRPVASRCLKKNVLTLFFESGPRHAPQERKRRSCVATIDIIYICSCIHVRVYNAFGCNSTPSFSLLWSVPRAGFEKKSEYIFLRHPAPRRCSSHRMWPS